MTGPVRLTARCICGQVEVEGSGRSISSLACYCDDCQAGAKLIEALPGAPPILDAGGGSACVLFRKDRFSVVRGEDLLAGVRLRPGTPTERVYATCCNSVMFSRFDSGPFWIPVYRDRIVGDAPPIQMRVNTRFAPDPSAIPADVPQHRGIAPRFALQLTLAFAGMLLRR